MLRGSVNPVLSHERWRAPFEPSCTVHSCTQLLGTAVFDWMVQSMKHNSSGSRMGSTQSHQRPVTHRCKTVTAEEPASETAIWSADML